MIVVSDSSPIITLAAVGHLELLRTLYGTVLLPKAVLDELTTGRAEAPGTQVRDLAWIQAAEVENAQLVEALSLNLDPGEAEAITLARVDPE